MSLESRRIDKGGLKVSGTLSVGGSSDTLVRQSAINEFEHNIIAGNLQLDTLYMSASSKTEIGLFCSLATPGDVSDNGQTSRSTFLSMRHEDDLKLTSKSTAD